MSALPSRTRSLRKPSENGSRLDRSVASNVDERVPASRAVPTERTSKSPSRLPMVRSTAARPTSLYGRTPSSSSSISTSKSSSIRPPSANSIQSQPAATELQRRPSINRNTTPPTTTEPVKKDRSRPPVTQSRHLRNASMSSVSSVPRIPSHTRTSSVSSTSSHTHTRTKSSSTILTNSTTLRPPSQTLTKEPPPPRVPRPEPQIKRPTFSTLQQHFSPAKSLAPKPHPAAFLAPPSPSKLPSNIAISAETAKLQNELLQLHLLHKDAHTVTREWKASAKQKLGSKFQDVVARNDALVQLEVVETANVNAAALKRWRDDASMGWGLDERIQALDEVVNGVCNLGEGDGKYARVVRKFERWLNRSQNTLASRENGIEEDVVFLEGLGHLWTDECLNINRKLSSWNQILRNLGGLDKTSSLGRIVEGYRVLVVGMLEEMKVMSHIEKTFMEREKNWIKGLNDEESDDGDGTPAGACWRAG